MTEAQQMAHMREKVAALEASLIQLTTVMIQTQTVILRMKSHVPAAISDGSLSADVDEMFKRMDDLMAKLKHTNGLPL